MSHKAKSETKAGLHVDDSRTRFQRLSWGSGENESRKVGKPISSSITGMVTIAGNGGSVLSGTLKNFTSEFLIQNMGEVNIYLGAPLLVFYCRCNK